MIIKKLNNVFHKHSRVLFGAFTLIIIVSFLGFLTPGQFGCGDMSFGGSVVGIAYGQKVTRDDFAETRRKLAILSLTGMLQVNTDKDDQVFLYHGMLVRAQQLGIQAGDKDIREFIRHIYSVNGAFDPEIYKKMLAALRSSYGIEEDKFLEAVRSQLVIEKLKDSFIGSVIVTDSEVEDFYRSYYTEYRAAAAVFTADSVEIAPTEEELKDFFAQHEKDYAGETRLQAVATVIPAAKFTAEAEKAVTVTVTEEQLKKFFEANIRLFIKDGKTPEFAAVRAEVRKHFVALDLAKRKAEDFIELCSERISDRPDDARETVFASVAAKEGFKMQPVAEAKYSGDALGRIKSREFVEALAKATDSSPVTDAVTVGDKVYVGCLVKTVPVGFEDVKTLVRRDYVLYKAYERAVREAEELKKELDPKRRLEKFRALKKVKFIDFTFSKIGNRLPKELEAALIELPSGGTVAVRVPNGGGQLFFLIGRTVPDAKKAFAEKKELKSECEMLCRFNKQSKAVEALYEDIWANWKLDEKYRSGR